MPFYPSCSDCGAELQETPRGLRCPWAKRDLESRLQDGVLLCGKPKGKITLGIDSSKDRYR